MARVKLELPTELPFQTVMDVSIGLVNYASHMGNDSALTVLHEARMRYLRALGFQELDIEGYGLIQADAVIVYKSQAVWGDRLIVEMALTDLSAYGYDFFYRVRHAGEARDVLHAKTGMVFFDYAANKPVRIPPVFLAAIAQAPQQGAIP